MGILRKLLPLLVLLLAALAILAGVGWLRPADHTAACRAVLRTQPEEVWKRVAAIEEWPEWVSAFESIRPRPDRDGHPAYEVATEFGDAELVVEERDEGGAMRTFLDGGSFRGRWTWELVEVPAGSQLTITERGTVDNPLLRGLMMFTDPHASMRGFLEDLGRELGCECSVTDVEVSPEGQGA